MSKSNSPSVDRSVAPKALRVALPVAVLSLLAACGDSKPAGSVGYVKGFGGMVAADEPRAAMVARDVLSAGGTAADAAVTLYFTMAVTQPSTASLGGGGSCVVYDREKNRTEVVEFLARPSNASSGQAPSAVPAAVRGMYALHAKYGKFRWEQMLAEPERLARAGTPISRSLAIDLARAAPALAQDAAARAIFFKDGRPLAEGQNLEQRDLAALIARIRRAPGDFYVGAQSSELIAAVTRAGGSLTPEDLRDVKPVLREPLTVKLGDDTAYFAPPPSISGGVAAGIAAALADRWGAASADERPHLLVEAAAQNFADRTRWMQPHGWPNEQVTGLGSREQGKALMANYNPDRHTPPAQAAKATEAIPAASFVVMDSIGGGVACSFTTYGLFGNGHVAPGTGMVLAAVPGLTSGPAAVGPVLVVNVNSQELRFAAAASGGATAATALAQTLLASQVEGRKIEDAVAAPRVHHSGAPDVTYVESGDRAFDPAPLTKRGHETKAVPLPSRVNAFACASGNASFAKCGVITDPRGSGLSLVVGKD